MVDYSQTQTKRYILKWYFLFCFFFCLFLIDLDGDLLNKACLKLKPRFTSVAILNQNDTIRHYLLARVFFSSFRFISIKW